MDIGEILTESIAYTKEALVGQWVRWLTFIILGLPVTLIGILYQKEMLMGRTTTSLENFPWVEIVTLVIIGILLSFFASGYVVRIYRGTKPAPDFDNWGELFFDGLKMVIVTLLWLLPVFIIILCVIGLAAGMAAAGPGSGSLLFLALILIGILVAIIIAIIVSLFSTMAVIRFARTGSITEGLRFSKVKEHIGNIGWGNYIVAVVVLIVVRIVVAVIIVIPSLIPVVGDIVTLVVSPLLLVFTARYYTLVYDMAGEQPVSD
ncbi:MAG: DUF4013 domain-containing protein [Methanoregula sp.]|jgi:hypothetical protein